MRALAADDLIHPWNPRGGRRELTPAEARGCPHVSTHPRRHTVEHLKGGSVVGIHGVIVEALRWFRDPHCEGPGRSGSLFWLPQAHAHTARSHTLMCAFVVARGHILVDCLLDL